MPAIAIPAPVGGWNAASALDKMPATDAVKLVNWIPRAGYVQTRNGRALHVDGLGASVETLATYRGTGGDAMIAGANGNLWDITGGVATSLASGFTVDYWLHTQHSNKIIFTNGTDAPQVYDGSTVAAADFSGSTGLTATDLWGCATFKGRAFYWAENAQSFWYAAAGSYQGAITSFDISTQLRTGGTLVMMLTWTLDSGSGVDDLAAFILTTGEVLVYQGDDPGDANAWSLIGVFQIGEPLGPRAHAKVGGTEIILTRDGYVDLSVALKDGRYSERSAYSAKIIRASKEAAADYGGFTGWQATLYPAGQLFIVNVPQSASQSIQHVRETSSGGWCEFSGWNARCFSLYDNGLYFGDADGRVWHADTGTADNGERILSWGIPAFNALGSGVSRKQLTAASVVSNAVRPAAYAYDGLSDFDQSLRASVPDDSNTTGTLWDSTLWDTAEWAVSGQTLPVRQAWKNVAAIGYTVTLSVRINQRGQQINWYSTNYNFRKAGIL